LQLAGIEPTKLDYLILTHRHPDHVYGFPILALDLWLLRPARPIEVVAEAEGLRTARALLGAFRTEQWPGFCPPNYHEMPAEEGVVVLDLPDLLIVGSPVEHLVPTMALKMTSKASGRSVVYSSDTSPCSSLVRLAHGADILVHEATGERRGHSSAAQAGQMAQRAGVQELYLIHYPALTCDLRALVAEARKAYPGPVEIARDFGAVEF
jgi:ribonuclease Z